MMIKKVKIIVLLMVLTLSVGVVSDTYSKYIANTTGNIDLMFANWQILVNNSDITGMSSSSITFEPVIDENVNIAKDVIAPSSTGYFDVNIDPSNVDVSFNYNIDLAIENANIPDLKITKYAIIPDDYVEGNSLEFVNIENNQINNTLSYNRLEPNFKFKPFLIRIYFEWTEGENELMNDSEDTKVGIDAANNNTTFKVNANISFQQVL